MKNIKEFYDNFYKHQYLSRMGGSIFYALFVAVALNFFWLPGKIYSSGFTGLSQLIAEIFHLPIAIVLLVVNLPMFLIAWFKISKRFASFTVMAVVLSSFFVASFKTDTVLTADPIIDAIFGGALNGLATGTALKYGVATGGLDIIGIFLKKKYDFKMGPVNLIFNSLLMLSSGLINGWAYAFYSMLGIFVSSKMIDSFYTKQQQIQVMIITDKKERVIEEIHKRMRRGVTFIDDAFGAYTLKQKTVLFTVITQQELIELKHALDVADPHAFSSTWKLEHQYGRFYEPDL